MTSSISKSENNELNKELNNDTNVETKKEKKPKKSNKGLVAAIIAILIIVCAIVGILIAGLSFIDKTLDKVTKVHVPANELDINPGVDEDLSDYRNIMLIGIDARDMDDDSNTRSDAMIIASIEKSTGEIRLISLYRDTYLDLGDRYGLDKLTHAYYYGGPQQTVQSINRNLDLNCKEFIVVNWKSVADTVDLLGGVEIDIQESEINEMNKYIIDTQRNIGGSKELIKKPGKQTLNGVQAVTYARIRKDHVTGDHRRNERMKILVAATFDKVKTLSFEEINELTTMILPQIKTNMTNAQMLDLFLDFTAYDITDTASWPYDWMDFTYYGVWYGPPVTLNSNVTQLHEDFFGQKDYVPTQNVQDISAEISTRTGRW